ncbi:cytochrome c oxidase accessory protein CcoG [Leptothrix cholodnii SP-6]|uniref:Cytochrome c oxidase accessory protein CcoG n=1 Tax=Leptothrix cholodnii (strain ATCC 51168 / LMG 8142 / SP-6) TaxID=395495 RepID=B1XWN9_LEPCP|nr:cytochrome c oxidase accessory protein CcoG [Leptothrix cholodnii]ACB35040.1 cytochrome c oxidase accessory protein CcoG [Leptothrix cholodnii SP-6]
MEDSSNAASPLPSAPAAGPAPASGSAANAAAKTVSLYEKTKKIYPKAVSGLFIRWRWILVWVTQIVFYGLPWLTWNDRQAVLFDLGSRRFYIFDLVLYPQDFIYLTAILIISAYALFLFTAVAGRLWCGYACPQTVYTEIFLWFEHRFEGDRAKRMKLDAGPWTADKWLRKSGKQLAWILFSLWTGFTLVGYFTPIHTLTAEAMTLGFGPWEWFWVLFYGFATYGNAGYMREQVCKYMCPYARFQSAMFDKDTLIITYDAERGEPRGSRSKKADPTALGLGACVDCNLCVQVCPTGIDIRKGLQYECIGCAACIDVCDSVMDKMGYARGLVRYTTQNGLDGRWTRAQMWRRALRPRVLIYTVILIVIVVALGVSIAMRSPFKVDVVRDRASLARIVDDGVIENVYRLQIMNATETTQSYRVAVEGLPGLSLPVTAPVQVASAEARWITVAVQLPPESASRAGSGAHTIHFDIQRVESGGAAPATLREKSTFVIPR